MTQRPSSGTIALVVGELQRLMGNRVVASQAVRAQHANTVTWVAAQPPDAVVFAESTEEVAAVVRLCSAHRVPVIPFGAGSSLEGHTNAPLGGICIDLTGMNAVLAVNAEDLDCVVQPGITRKRLNEELRDRGLFFPIDPGADATLGGMTSTRASGTNAVRYGTMKDNVLALTVVLPSGEVIRTGSRARKSSAGYDMTRLFVGAEGTLGVITEITLRLHGIPEAVSGGVCVFPTVEAACSASIAAIQAGIPVARMELADETQVRAINLYSKLALRESPTLFLEFHGSPAGVEEQAQRFGEIAEDQGGGPFEWATRAEDRSRLWQARHDAYWSALALRPGGAALSTDVCVPISRLAECVVATQQDIAGTGLIAPIVGHVGDGNFHVIVVMDPADSAEKSAVEGFLDRLVERALAMGGTSTGEHGIGQKKMRYMVREHGEAAVGAMRAVKQALDPLGIMNPGKVLPS